MTPLLEVLRAVNSETESRRVVTRGGGEGDRKLVFNGDGGSGLPDGKASAWVVVMIA